MKLNGLYALFLQRLAELEKFASKDKIIRFPTVFKKICRTFMIDKKAAWELLFLFQDLGFIEIVRFQGIRLKESAVESSLEISLSEKKAERLIGGNDVYKGKGESGLKR